MRAQTEQTKLTLENIVITAFHPKGVRKFVDTLNYELELGSVQSSINQKLAICFDVIKYAPYVTIIGRFAYEFLK